MTPKLAIAIETSTRRGGIAVRSGKNLREIFLDPGAAHASQLLPSLEALLAEMGADREEIDFLAVGTGPGSYTGLRVGISMALALAQAAEAALAGVSSFAALASEVPQDGVVAAIGNAYGGEVYLALFEKQGGRLSEILPPSSLPAAEALQRIPPNSLLLGEGVPLLLDRKALDAFRVLPEELWLPKPSATLRLGLLRLQERGPDDPRRVRPLYLRPSRAEIQHREKKSSSSSS